LAKMGARRSKKRKRQGRSEISQKNVLEGEGTLTGEKEREDSSIVADETVDFRRGKKSIAREGPSHSSRRGPFKGNFPKRGEYMGKKKKRNRPGKVKKAARKISTGDP